MRPAASLPGSASADLRSPDRHPWGSPFPGLLTPAPLARAGNSTPPPFHPGACPSSIPARTQLSLPRPGPFGGRYISLQALESPRLPAAGSAGTCPGAGCTRQAGSYQHLQPRPPRGFPSHWSLRLRATRTQ